MPSSRRNAGVPSDLLVLLERRELHGSPKSMAPDPARKLKAAISTRGTRKKSREPDERRDGEEPKRSSPSKHRSGSSAVCGGPAIRP